jgi:ribosomal protein S12 methylthiotransferase
MKKNKVDIITLGCSKNLVDSERLMRLFAAAGYRVEHDPRRVNGEIVVVNTCGFINDAKEESLRMILEMGEAKKNGRISQLYVMGCLSERFMSEMQAELPEVDRFYGKFNWKELLSDLGKTSSRRSYGRILTTPPHYAYLKISEGCNRSCSYCSIPIMTGSHESRPIEEIEEEARTLARGGVRELQVIAQDLTYYGLDLYKQLSLPELTESLADVPGIEWIRLHYAYPSPHFPFDLLRVMRERENVCNYLDIALQHISDPILRRMRRNVTKDQTYALLERIRNEVPGIHLRTTLMVGHPGETDKDFEELADFVQKMRFERMGAFMYSHEEGTYSYANYADDVTPEVKQERLDTLMSIQESISASVNEEKNGRTLKVIIDSEENEFYTGRTEYDSPEVDNEVFVTKNKTLDVGRFHAVNITKTTAFDLYGEAMNS